MNRPSDVVFEAKGIPGSTLDALRNVLERNGNTFGTPVTGLYVTAPENNDPLKSSIP